MKKEYRKPEIETIVLNNQPMLAGQSHPDADAKRGVSFDESEEDDEESIDGDDNKTVW
jgi:hypothetical protein